MSESASACRFADCPVRATGECKHGFDPVDGCPDFGPSNEVLAELPAAVEHSEEFGQSELVRLPSGDVMQIPDVADLLRSERLRIVALVGEQQAGKTTLLASIYQQYCKGPFAGHLFAGSRTLTAFARRHHMSLLSSGRIVPSTPRTSRFDPVGFLHLMLRPILGGPMQNLLISDRSGEAFEAARTDTALVSELVEMRQASRVCFLLDGGRFLLDDQRAGYTRRFKQMIRALYDNGALRPGVTVEILTTKIDKLSKVPQSDRIMSILSECEDNLIRDFSAMGINIENFRICALPRADYSLGYPGLEEALGRWTAPRPPSEVRPVAAPDAVRQIDRLAARWFLEAQP